MEGEPGNEAKAEGGRGEEEGERGGEKMGSDLIRRSSSSSPVQPQELTSQERPW